MVGLFYRITDIFTLYIFSLFFCLKLKCFFLCIIKVLTKRVSTVPDLYRVNYRLQVGSPKTRRALVGPLVKLKKKMNKNK